MFFKQFHGYKTDTSVCHSNFVHAVYFHRNEWPMANSDYSTKTYNSRKNTIDKTLINF